MRFDHEWLLFRLPRDVVREQEEMRTSFFNVYILLG